LLTRYLQEAIVAEFEQKKREREEASEAKTSKNRAKRQKKKERAKAGKEKEAEPGAAQDVPLKKRRLVNGAEITFKRPGEESDEEDEDIGPQPTSDQADREESRDAVEHTGNTPLAEAHQIIIHEDN
jgi:hypothetical protein